MEQRIEITNNGLVVYTDNGKVAKDGASCEIKGTFLVNADTVALLLSHFNDNVLRAKYVWNGGRIFYATTHEEICDELEKKCSRVEKLESKVDYLCCKLNDLQREIDAFNASRFPWERKIKVKL